MADDWIKMRTHLGEDPAVIAIASMLNLDEDMVVGKLHRMWSWWDQHTTDGNARNVTKLWLDRYLRVDGFAQAMSVVGWLIIADSGLIVPKFDDHNGETAKARGLTSRRVAKSRSKCNASVTARPLQNAMKVVTAALPRIEENRLDEKTEEKREEELPLSSESKEILKTLEDELDPETQKKADRLTGFGADPRTHVSARFISLYPRKAKKGFVADAFDAAVAILVAAGRSDEEAIKFIEERTQAYARSPSGQPGEPDVRPDPAKWLAGQQFDDDPNEWLKPNGNRPRNGTAVNVSSADGAIEAYRRLKGNGNVTKAG